MKVLLVLFFIFSINIEYSHAVDIAITNVNLFYNDNQTNNGKEIVRKLIHYSDDEYWSKPDVVDVVIDVKNNSKSEPADILLTPELYFLVRRNPDNHYQDIGIKCSKKNMLSSIENVKKFWIWNRVLASKPPIRILPQELKSVRFIGVNIKNEYYPTEYDIVAFSIRVYATLVNGDDPDICNNIGDSIVDYAD